MSGDQSVEELLPCPFVPTHFIRAGTRFQRHLERCRRECLKVPNSPFYEAARDKVSCSFEDTHVVWPQDMEQHLAHCERAAMVMKSIADVRLSEEPTAFLQPPPSPPLGSWGASQAGESDDEDWDRDMRLKEARGIQFKPYDPQAKVQQEGPRKAFLLVPQGKSRSERIAHRRETRITSGQAWDETDSTASTAGSTRSSASTSGSGKSTSSVSGSATVSSPNQWSRWGPASPHSDSEAVIRNDPVPHEHTWEQVPRRRGRGRGRGRAGASDRPAGPPDPRGRAQTRRGRGDWGNRAV